MLFHSIAFNSNRCFINIKRQISRKAFGKVGMHGLCTLKSVLLYYTLRNIKSNDCEVLLTESYTSESGHVDN